MEGIHLDELTLNLSKSVFICKVFIKVRQYIEYLKGLKVSKKMSIGPFFIQ